MRVYALVTDGIIINVLPEDVLSASGEDTGAWTLIDEGEGERYDRAQYLYLPNGLWDSNGERNYKFVDGVPVLRTDGDKSERM